MANELIIPPDIAPESPAGVTLVDDQTQTFTPMFGRNWTQRNSFGDPRWRFEHRYRGLRQKDQARMHAVVSEAQGRFRTVMVSPGQSNRGSMSLTYAIELFSNSTFDTTTGWTAQGSVTRSVSNGILRLTLNGPPASTPAISQSITSYVQYAPYCLRSLIREGAGMSGILMGTFLNTGNYSTTLRGYVLQSAVLTATSMSTYPIVVPISSGAMAGAFVDVLFTSVARCALVDGGGNFFQRSDELENAYWTATNLASRTANAHTAPDGTTTADRLVENGSAGQHNIARNETRTSAAEDWCAYAVVGRSVGTRNFGLIIGRDGTNYTRAAFTLSGSGTVSSVTDNGDNTNGRAFIVSLGNGEYFCYVVAALTASTNVLLQCEMLDASLNVSYTGDGVSAILLWRTGATRSSMPTRGAQSTSAAVSAVSQPVSGQPTGQLYLKGLPVSQSDLAVPGDWFEIDGQLKRVTMPLNSDAAGLGVLYFRPKLHRAVADNTPVIFNKPLGRFMLPAEVKFDSMFGLNSDYNLTLDEVYE